MRYGLLILVVAFCTLPLAYSTPLEDEMRKVDWSTINSTLANTEWLEEITDQLKGSTTNTEIVSPISVETNMVDVELQPGDSNEFSLTIRNDGETDLETDVSFSGEIVQFIDIRQTRLNIARGDEEVINFRVDIPLGTSIGVYPGEVSVKSNEFLKQVSTTVVVVPSEEPNIDVKTQVLSREIERNEPLLFLVDLNNIGGADQVNVSLFYYISNLETEEIITSSSENLLLRTTLTLSKTVELSEDIKPGKYSVEVLATYAEKETTASDFFEMVRPIPWSILFGLLGVCISGYGGFRVKKHYDMILESKKRFISPLEYATLPEGGEDALYIGKIAESKKKTYLDSNDLLTHMLIAGGTGFGKTVAAMDIIEEILKQKIPVVVFDPTLQWTGFLKSCKDEKMLSLYKDFDLTEEDSQAFKGSIVLLDDPEQEIRIDDYLNPGEITVFGLGKLEAAELAKTITNIIGQISKNSTESPDLKGVLVFDEVHRLLPEYGGEEGYAAVENAVGSFRRLGLGVILVSQVLSDFKASIHGNIGTEIQLKTKYDGDLERVAKKYGDDFAKTLIKEVVGVGMIQNTKYNNGKPYFVHFRPLLHSPERFPEAELLEHDRFVKTVSRLEATVRTLKEKGIDTYEFDLEINLAKDKLKQGYASMAKIYLESVEKKVSIVGD